MQPNVQRLFINARFKITRLFSAVKYFPSFLIPWKDGDSIALHWFNAWVLIRKFYLDQINCLNKYLSLEALLISVHHEQLSVCNSNWKLVVDSEFNIMSFRTIFHFTGTNFSWKMKKKLTFYTIFFKSNSTNSVYTA